MLYHFITTAQLVFLSLQKARVSRKLISNKFAGIISKRMLLNSMSKNDLLLTNHCNDNDVCTILGKSTVLDWSSEEGSDNTAWVSRLSAIMADGRIRVTTANDEGFLCEGKTEKRKVGIVYRKEMHVSSLKKQKSASCSLMPDDLVQIKGKGTSHHAPDLWTICGLCHVHNSVQQ